MGVRERVRALERRATRWPRWDECPRLRDPAVRARCVEVQLQLQVEAKGLEAIRHATREIMALFVEKEDPERAAAIRRNEVEVELDLNGAQRRVLQAAAQAVMALLEGGRRIGVTRGNCSDRVFGSPDALRSHWRAIP